MPDRGQRLQLGNDRAGDDERRGHDRRDDLQPQGKRCQPHAESGQPADIPAGKGARQDEDFGDSHGALLHVAERLPGTQAIKKETRASMRAIPDALDQSPGS